MGALLLSGSGYHVIGAGQWSWLDCFYMAAITLSTVGFGETLPGMDAHNGARAWTLVVIFVGSGSLLYFVSMLTAVVVEGDLRGTLRFRRMQGRIDTLEGHIILCGGGRTGAHIARELVTTGVPFVMIEHDEEVTGALLGELGERFVYIQGDASDDQVLRDAGIERARGLVAALPDDRDNLFVTISARTLNERVRIIAKCIGPGTDAKLRRAGANSVVSPYFIGAMRMASEMVRPAVVKFLDRMLRDEDKALRIEEVPIPVGSPLDGVTLATSELRQRHEVLVLAVQDAHGVYTYNPEANHLLVAGDTLVVLARSSPLNEMRSFTEA